MSYSVIVILSCCARLCARLMEITGSVSPVSPAAFLEMLSDLGLRAAGPNGTEGPRVRTALVVLTVSQPENPVPSAPFRGGGRAAEPLRAPAVRAGPGPGARRQSSEVRASLPRRKL